MSEARAQIFAAIGKALGPTAATPGRAQAVTDRIAGHPRNLVPARSALPPAGQVTLFAEMATAVAATVTRVRSLADVPAEVASYLARHNLPARLCVSPDRELDAVPWVERPLLDVRRGRPTGDDLTGVTGAEAAIAETGTLLLISGSDKPSTLNFLPDNHIVVLETSQVVGAYEDAFDRLRARGALPRTVNLITGPSRTGDIEQKIQLGAHGPRRLHIILVDAPAA